MTLHHSLYLLFRRLETLHKCIWNLENQIIQTTLDKIHFPLTSIIYTNPLSGANGEICESA